MAGELDRRLPPGLSFCGAEALSLCIQLLHSSAERLSGSHDPPRKRGETVRVAALPRSLLVLYELQEDDRLPPLDLEIWQGRQQELLDHSVGPHQLIGMLPTDFGGRLVHKNPSKGSLQVLEYDPVCVADTHPRSVLKSPMPPTLRSRNHQTTLRIDETGQVFRGNGPRF